EATIFLLSLPSFNQDSSRNRNPTCLVFTNFLQERIQRSNHVFRGHFSARMCSQVKNQGHAQVGSKQSRLQLPVTLKPFRRKRFRLILREIELILRVDYRPCSNERRSCACFGNSRHRPRDINHLRYWKHWISG